MRDHGAPPRAGRTRSRRALRPRVRRGFGFYRRARGRGGRGRRARDHGERLDHALRRGRRRPDRPVSRGIPGGGYMVGLRCCENPHVCLEFTFLDELGTLDRTAGGFCGGRHCPTSRAPSMPRANHTHSLVPARARVRVTQKSARAISQPRQRFWRPREATSRQNHRFPKKQYQALRARNALNPAARATRHH